MNNIDIKVNISPEKTAELIKDQIINGSISGELIDEYIGITNDNKRVIVLIFEKYYIRNNGRASLSVTIENLSDITKIHAVGSGASQGFIFKFDWGASLNFIDQVSDILNEYKYN